MIRHQTSFTPAPVMLDRLARMAEAIKTETRWQLIADARGPLDLADYRKMRMMFVIALGAIRGRRVADDVLDGIAFWDAVEAYGKMFSILIQHRKAARATP